MKIIVLGYLVRGPLGGMAWHHFQYVLGLKLLGHNVLFIEDSDNYPSCYNPSNLEISTNPQYGLQFINKLFTHFNFQESWAYFDFHTNTWFGLNKKKVLNFCSSADIVINLSAVNPIRDWWFNIPVRIYLDTDPGFVQIKHLTKNESSGFAKQHNFFFSFAENIGKPSCLIPDDGFQWKPTRQPIFLPAWKASSPKLAANWTTVMQWDSYQSREYNGLKFGMKSLSFTPYKELPQTLKQEKFELALGSASAPGIELEGKGWIIISPLKPTLTPWTYQDYISNSKGEWTIAKHGYVASNSGWFSERTLCYMASGKPVVIQDTGFSDFLPCGIGLLPFNTLEEVKESINRVNRDYQSHCIRARQIVEEFFDSSMVLQNLLRAIS